MYTLLSDDMSRDSSHHAYWLNCRCRILKLIFSSKCRLCNSKFTKISYKKSSYALWLSEKRLNGKFAKGYHISFIFPCFVRSRLLQLDDSYNRYNEIFKNESYSHLNFLESISKTRILQHLTFLNYIFLTRLKLPVFRTVQFLNQYLL